METRGCFLPPTSCFLQRAKTGRKNTPNTDLQKRARIRIDKEEENEKMNLSIVNYHF